MRFTPMDPVLEELLYSPDHPQRPPDWRWCYAKKVRDAPAKGRKLAIYDSGVELAVKIQTIWGSRLTPKQQKAEYLKLGPAYLAYTFWNEAHAANQLDTLDMTPKERARAGYRTVPSKVSDKARFEAYILAGQSDEFVQSVSNLPAEAVRCYEHMFFDVRSRLQYPMWVSRDAIGDLHQNNPYSSTSALIKAYGYYSKSTRIIDAVASTFDAELTKLAADNYGTFYNRDQVSAQSLKAALSSRMMGMNSYTFERIIEIHQDAQKLAAELKTGTDAEARDELGKSLNILSGQIEKWGYGEEPTNLADERNQTLPRLAIAAAEEAV